MCSINAFNQTINHDGKVHYFGFVNAKELKSFEINIMPSMKMQYGPFLRIACLFIDRLQSMTMHPFFYCPMIGQNI